MDVLIVPVAGMVNCAFTMAVMLLASALFLSAGAPGALWRLDDGVQPLASRPVVRANATILRSATAAPFTPPGEVHRQVRAGPAGAVGIEFE